MLVIGVTGGLGMGKSVSGCFLDYLGIPVIDSDELARQHTLPGSLGLEKIVKRFGPEFLDSNGFLNRKKLASYVFSVPEELRALETILHPMVSLSWRMKIGSLKESGQRLCVLLVPLLFEKGYQTDAHHTVAVGCSNRTQRLRLINRGMSEDEITARNAAQWCINKKMAQADFVVWNDGQIIVLHQQWLRILKALRINE